MRDRQWRNPLRQAPAAEAACADEHPVDSALTHDRGDVTIEVWSPRPEPAKARTIGFAPRHWVPLAAAAVLLITVGALLLTRRR